MQAGEITVLLNQASPNDKADMDHIYALLYNEIKAIANNQLAQVHNNGTISATVLAHECYLNLIRLENPVHQDRRHLLNYLAKAMRRFLIDQIRSKNRDKRKGQMDYNHMSQILGANDIDFDLIEIDRLIDVLEEINPHLAELFQQKILFNFTFKELAQMFDLSERQVIRQWNQAKTLLLTMIESPHGSE
ncbi:hypothetical protein MNBD_GAMMA02-1536 [hydrothermal vent metagenome]|uniref:RNA polymerase sigma-70 ECF-like HTH domain-containing protein n=1 Tax=hydrothermal vent metagenome TaxID=652676 RepID=A0A3B0VKI2_9ZZZZ